MFSNKHPFLTAISLALGSAIALGLGRFSYGLLLPLMREDLQWSYLLAGAMNTANAIGYLVGALSCPFFMRKISVNQFFIVACLLTAFFLFLSGVSEDARYLFLMRILSGITSSWIFVAGGVLVSQLASLNAPRSGLLLGIFYGGPGLGILLSSLIIPFVNDWGIETELSHIWQFSWYALGITCLVLTILLLKPVYSIPSIAKNASEHAVTPLRSYWAVLTAYFLFGIGYIGYMTFVIALLKQMGLDSITLNVFYSVLGFAVMASSRLWAKMLDFFRGGQSLAILNSLLGVACLMPAALSIYGVQMRGIAVLAVFFSGILFGGVFLSAVASTTAFVKHNMPKTEWVSGITAFTSIFAAGQIIGPTIVGWISDGQGGLAEGLTISGVALLFGGLIAARQVPLVQK